MLSVVCDFCAGNSAAGIVDWVVSGRAVLCTLAAPVRLECNACNGSNETCVSTNPTVIKPLELLSATLPHVPKSRLRDELPILVARLVQDAEWGVIAELLTLFPLTFGTAFSDWACWDDIDVGSILKTHSLSPLTALVKAGILQTNVCSALYNYVPRSVQEAHDKVHITQYCRWLANDCTVAMCAPGPGVRLALTQGVRRQCNIPEEIIVKILRMASTLQTA